MHHLDIWIKVDQLDDTCFIIYCSTCFRWIFRSLRLLVALFCKLTWGVLVLCSGIVCWWCCIRVQAEPLPKASVIQLVYLYSNIPIYIRFAVSCSFSYNMQNLSILSFGSVVKIFNSFNLLKSCNASRFLIIYFCIASIPFGTYCNKCE